MSATVMDGAAIAKDILRDTAHRAEMFERTAGRKPCLAMVIVGDDPASHAYVRMKVTRCRATGVDPRCHIVPGDARSEDVERLVRDLSGDETVDGVFVQYPLPSQIDRRLVFDAITPTKDVDGVTSASVAAMALGAPGLLPCTPAGIMRLLEAYGIDPAGQRAVVIGRSPLLGKPVGMLLLARDATVTYCPPRTRDLPALVGEADIVVAAAGRPGLIRGAWVKRDAVVIDAGYFNPGNIGDVEYESACARARFIAPVPGGVGPVTIAVLLAQTVDAAVERRASQLESVSYPRPAAPRALDPQ